ncbi:hypothetical protein EJ04DRAFT_513480 [Polyplosphaeria fusca]|uniref:Ricin B lectin domain-containing protein n=1 Tax=Polyplosphaeria fusca TaxID=682080 RepID=A0A9P4QUQ5_9PLEO|nr:hypothetical protein EJ04DRAFT_513480 [Polyplosphaeria fusca]
MVNIQTGVNYILANAALSSDQVLTSSTLNDSVIITTLNSPIPLYSQLWFFTAANDTYYRLHTREKGNDSCLDMLSYYDHQELDLHFFYDDDAKYAQFWQFSDAGNGAVTLSNAFLGGDTHLEVDTDTLSLKLKGGSNDGQRWILSQRDEDGTSMTATRSVASPARTSGFSTRVSATTTDTASVTGSLAASATAASDSGGLSKSAKAGLGAGLGVGIAALIAVLILFCCCCRGGGWRAASKNRTEVTQVDAAPHG